MKKKSIRETMPYSLQKIFRAMRLTLFIYLVGIAQVFALNSYSQQTKLNLEMKNTQLGTVLDEIENQSEFYFLFNEKMVDMDRRVSVNIKDKNISDALNSLFYGTNVEYLISNRQIVLSVSDFEFETISQQDRRITGSVVESIGGSLPGVSVFVKGTTVGTITDFDGKFELDIPAGSDILVISFIGMRTQEITIGGQSVINVQMEADVIGLEEVVAIGYGTMKKSDLTGTVGRFITSKNIDLPNLNVLQSLKGNISGLSIGTPDQAGEEPSLKIRGTNSISAGNKPLVVVDGIIFNGSLNSLSINDIESVDVLKDASAAAVYGSRSGNGVIIITTKKGISEKPTFNFTASYGVSDPMYIAPALSSEGYVQKILDYRVATNQEANPANINDYLTVTESNNLDAGKTVNWQDELIQTAPTQNYVASVSGRTEKTNYYLSASYYGQEGIVENDDFNRTTARANFSNKITDWFTVSVKSSFSNMDYSGEAVGMYLMLSPYSNYYEGGADSGELEEFPMEDPYFRHPYINTTIDDHDVRNDLFGMISSEIKVPFIEGLKWTMNYSLNQRTNRKFRFTPNTIAKTTNGSAYKQVQSYFDWTLDNIVNYKRIFNDVHSVDATFLVSREYQRAEVTRADATNFFNQALGYHGLELGAVPSVSSGFGEQNQNAIMGRLNYIYKNTYALTGTVRRDGFSGFAEGNKYATFYSGAFAWTVSNEAFMQDISWLDRLKLRISYGQNGNQAIGRYQTLARMGNRGTESYAPYGNYVFGDGGGTSNGVFVTSMANNQLGWETTEVNNLGIDFGIFNNVLSGSIDVYSSKTEDLLLKRNIPKLTGFSTVWTNIGQVNNKGIEIALNSRNINTSDFSWQTGFTFDLNRNSIESLFGVDDDGDGIEDDDIANKWFIGKSLGVHYGYGIDGIHQSDETDIPSGYQPGDFRIVDYDDNGELSSDDKYILGYTAPNYQFSISNTLTYKNWSLYAMINSIQGGGKNNYYMSNNMPSHNPNSQFASWTERFSFAEMDYWTPDNPSNTAARINYSATRGHSYLEDRSFVRLQDVTLSYTFSDSFIGKWGLGSLRAYASGKNLYTWTKWTGYDPENATNIYSRPMMRTFTFGINLEF